MFYKYQLHSTTDLILKTKINLRSSLQAIKQVFTMLHHGGIDRLQHGDIDDLPLLSHKQKPNSKIVEESANEQTERNRRSLCPNIVRWVTG
jgi:hypothetical protein